MKKIYKLTAIILSIFLIVSSVPFSAYAETTQELEDAVFEINSDMYAEAYSDSVTLSWYFDSYYYKSIEGFYILESVNGGDFNTVKTVSISTDYRYSLSFSSPSRYCYCVKFKICPYYTKLGKTYQSSSKEEAASYVSDSVVSISTKSNAVQLNFNNYSNAKFKIDYYQYNISARSYSGLKTAYASGSSYSIANNSRYTALDISVTPYWGSTLGETIYGLFSHEGMNLLKNAGKSKTNKIKVINTRKKKAKTAWTEKLTKKDKKIIKKFFYKKYKGKYPSRAEMAEYAYKWIHYNVKYAYDKHPKTKKNLYKKIAKCSYVEAIFNKKLGQCLQYNGAMAKVLTYLGYESRIIMGVRASGTSHYWCEVKINGRWYLIETGNYDKNGEWMHFVELYGDGMGYKKCGKPARD